MNQNDPGIESIPVKVTAVTLTGGTYLYTWTEVVEEGTTGAWSDDVSNPRSGDAVNGPFLAPGIGAQGAGPAELRQVFGASLSTVLPSSSREVLRGGPSIDGLREAATKTLDDVTAALR